LLLLATVALAPTAAFADTQGTKYVGAVGNAVGAALQTAGLYAQSTIIEDFGRGIEVDP
jgi:hypothetical protein